MFEIPIDALSLATLLKVKRTAWDKCNYLSLGGTAPLALLQFLKDHPEIKQVYLCLDIDKAGLDGIAWIEAGFSPNCPRLYLRLYIDNAIPREHKDSVDMAHDMRRRGGRGREISRLLSQKRIGGALYGGSGFLLLRSNACILF